MSENGKGDTPRPISVPKEVFDSNFERIFGKTKEKPVDAPETPEESPVEASPWVTAPINISGKCNAFGDYMLALYEMEGLEPPALNIYSGST